MNDEADKALKSGPTDGNATAAAGPRQRRGPAMVPETSAAITAPQAKIALPSPYEYIDILGRGGMGVVYLAKDTSQNREVAIKFLTATGQEAASLAKRFQREASQLASLRHPNIVGFYDAGYFQKQNYIVMEYVRGGSLRSLLKAQQGSLSLEQGLNLFATVCDGLEYIHQQGLIHRDFKPDNIMLDENQQPKIGDFGLALKLEDQSRITQSGMILGTYSYLSPEQILSKDIGPAADLYALGCCMYEAFTGRPVFSGDTEFSLLNSHLRQAPVAPRQICSDIPPELDALILSLLQKHPGERPENSAEVARTLRRLQQSLRQVWTLPVAGRDDAIAQLEQLLHPCTQHQPVGVLLTAPTGQGRSCTVRKLVTRLQKNGITVHPLVPLPYQQEPTEELYKSLGGTQENWLEALSRGGPQAVAELLWKQLEQLGAPRLLVIDDPVRQPATSNAVFQCLSAQAPPPGLGWLISCIEERAHSLQLWQGCSHVQLQPLDDQALCNVAQLQLNGQLSSELRQELLSRSQGSVRRLRLWLLALRGARLLRREGQQVVHDTSHPWPCDLWEPLWLQLSARSENEVKLLRIAGLLDEPFAYELVQELSEVDQLEARAARDMLLRDGLLEECWGQAGELYQFSSAELKEKLQNSATDRLKRRVYGRCAQLLENRAPLSIQANYLHRAGMNEQALPKFLQAALEAEQIGDLRQAEQNWRSALGICGEHGPIEVRLMALTGLCQVLLKSNRLEEVESSASEALEHPLPENTDSKRLRRQLSGLVARSRWLRQQRGAGLMDFCQRELDQLAHTDYSDSLWLTWCCAAVELEAGNPREGLSQLNRLTADEHFPAPFFWLQACLLRSLGRYQEAQQTLLQGLQTSTPGNSQEEVELLLELVQVQILLGQSAEQQEQWFNRALDLVSQSHNQELLAEIEWVRGRIREAQHDMGAALRAYQKTIDAAPKNSYWLAQGYLQLGLALQRLDRTPEAEKSLLQGLQLSHKRGENSFNIALACLQIQRGNWQEACRYLEDAQTNQATPTTTLLYCWCLYYQEQAEAAQKLFESLDPPKDPLERWLKQRIENLLKNIPEPWPPADERAWALAGHPARAILNRLLPSQRRDTVMIPNLPLSSPTPSLVLTPPIPVVKEPEKRQSGLHPLFALLGLSGLLLIGYGVWQMSKTPSANPVISPTPLVSASTEITPEISPTAPEIIPTSTPSAAPQEQLVKMNLKLSPPKDGFLIVQGPPERKLRIVKGYLDDVFPQGTLKARLEVRGFVKQEREFSLAESVNHIDVILTPLKGEVILRVQPGPVKVTIDNNPTIRVEGTGTVERSFKGLTVGPHLIRVEKQGYYEEKKKFNVLGDDTQRWAVKLEEIPPAPPPEYRPYNPPPVYSQPPPVYKPPPPVNPYSF